MSSVETGEMSAVETGQMSAAEAGQMSAVETRQMSKSQIRGRAQNHKNDPKWVENGRQVLRIGSDASHGRSQASGTGPVAQIWPVTQPERTNPRAPLAGPGQARPKSAPRWPEASPGLTRAPTRPGQARPRQA